VCPNDLGAMPAGTICSWQGLPNRTGHKREARLRETNRSSTNGGFADGLVTLPSKIKYSKQKRTASDIRDQMTNDLN